MDTGELKTNIQKHLTDGLALIVGSGLSCAEGIPGMGQLAKHIIAKAEEYPVLRDYPNWKALVGEIEAKGLEATFLSHQLPDELEAVIMLITADFLRIEEERIIAEVVAGKRTLRFTRLLNHLMKPNTGIPIVTTNYDRLVELAAEDAGLGVHTMFCGQYLGKLNSKESKLSLCREVVQRSRSVSLTYRHHVCVFKPHGSLDWYLRNGQPVRYAGHLDMQRLMITPGLNKFRSGYNSPFDTHREEANKVIDSASRYLIVGYGFNDDHLETHLKPAIESGKPTILLTYEASDKAKALIKSSPNFMALEAAPSDATRVITKDEEWIEPNSSYWDVHGLVDGVLT
jgi:hypothetical protein